jgi:hypothetical protein
MGKQTKQFLEEVSMANKHKEMFNIFSHKRNTNQNYTEIPSCSCQNGNHQENKQNQMLVRMQEKGILIHCSWECKLVPPLWK